MGVNQVYIPADASGAKVLRTIQTYIRNGDLTKIVLTKHHHNKLARYLRQVGATGQPIKFIKQLFGVPVKISAALQPDRMNLHQ